MTTVQSMKIKSILVDDGQGYYYAQELEQAIYIGSVTFKNIEPVNRNGEMAAVRWFECYDYFNRLVKEINGKYVIEIEYE